jgi:hypothetical protein
MAKARTADNNPAMRFFYAWFIVWVSNSLGEAMDEKMMILRSMKSLYSSIYVAMSISKLCA